MSRTYLVSLAVAAVFGFGTLVPAAILAQSTPVGIDPAQERDARRLSDLQEIKKALRAYADYHNGDYPSYDIWGSPKSDGYWRSTVVSGDFRVRLKPYLNQIPIDPLNLPEEHFHYVYARIPALNPPWGAPCVGKTILSADRVETATARYEECNLGDLEPRIIFVITSEEQTTIGSLFASPFFSLWRLFSLFAP